LGDTPIAPEKYGETGLWGCPPIKNCALSSLAGDCQLIEKMYLGEHNSSDQPAIRFLDKGKTRIEYFNEKKEKISDSKDIFGKKIANNLQNSLPF
jgi:hypothetical protein